jgi:hypothetical protein
MNLTFLFIQHSFLNYVSYLTTDVSLFKLSLAFLWRNLGTPLKSSVRIAGILPRYELRLSEVKITSLLVVLRFSLQFLFHRLLDQLGLVQCTQ